MIQEPINNRECYKVGVVMSSEYTPKQSFVSLQPMMVVQYQM